MRKHTAERRRAADVAGGARIAGTAIPLNAGANRLTPVQTARRLRGVRATQSLITGEAFAALIVHTSARRLCSIRTY